MDKKLTFPLINQIASRLLLKIAVFCVTLFLLLWSDLSWWAYSIFFITSLVIYISELPQSRLIKFSLFSLFWVSMAAVYFFVYSSFFDIFPFGLLMIVILGFVLFIALGVVSFFKNHYTIFRLLNTIILFLIILSVFYGKFFFKTTPFIPWLGNLILLVFSILLFKEALSFLGISLAKKTWQISFIVGFLSIEIAWILMFLPLGFINAAVFLSLFLVLVRDGIVAHFSGFFNRNLFLYELTFFVILGIAIFAATRWNI